LQTSFTKAKRRVADLEELVKMNQASFAQMSTVNAELKAELQQRFSEQQAKEEKMRRTISEMKREIAGLKELVGVKDKQIEDMVRAEQRDRENIERVSKDNKEIKNQLTKRELEMKEVLRTVKFFSEEKTKLEAELHKLQLENQQLIGHKNPNQKI
jgi:chromosome segregation ATPase